MERRHKAEIAAVSIVTAVAVGGIVVRYAQNARLRHRAQEADPSILHEPRLGSERIMHINEVAGYILYNEKATQSDLVRDLDYSRHHISHLVNYLMDRSLVAHVDDASAESGPKSYYIATEGLAEAAKDPSYNLLAAAVELAHDRSLQQNGT